MPMIILVSWLITALIAPAQPAQESTPHGQCAVPAIEVAEADEALRGAFAPGSANYKEIARSLEKAFLRSCEKTVLKPSNLQKFEEMDPTQLFLVNAPNANIASIYWRAKLMGQTRLVLEYPFVTEDGSVNVPTGEEIEEAIYCAVKGATSEEQETSGRCLPD